MAFASRVIRGAIRAVATTVGAALAGTGIFFLPLLLRLAFGDFALYLLLIFPVYFVAICLLGWPTIAVLRALGFRNRESFMAAGAVWVALVGLIVSQGFADQLVEQLLWVISGALSGAAVGAIIGTFDGSRMVHAEQLEDQLSGYTKSITYRAFFSYSRADGTIADWLWEYLDKYRVPSGLVGVAENRRPLSNNLHPIFRDRFDLSAGGNLSTRLQSALERSDNLIVLCTPESAKSAWVEHEVQTFLGTGRESRILPVIAAGEPDSADPSIECFPPALRGRGILAADLRETGTRTQQGRQVGDGREFGALKVIAGLLGVDFDQLIRREHRRQQSRSAILIATVALTTSLAAAALLFAYVAVGSFAWNQRNLEDAFASELDYLTLVHRSDGVDGVKRYLDTRSSLSVGRASRFLCPYLIDPDGVPFGQHPPQLRLPFPSDIGKRESFSLELKGRTNYAGSPFYRRLDGLIERISPTHAIAVSFCNYDPPLFYGVFRAFFVGRN
jgi:MTH538 TIR-like domain (DUF1863)